jgi:hypothetical protein
VGFSQKLRSEKFAANDRITGGAIILVVVAGAALRVWQYAANTSLSVDEIALANSILTFDIKTLLTNPLPHYQVAPEGFLLVQKLAVLTFGPGEYTLRLFPFICALMSLVLFAYFALRILNRVAAIAAVVLFASAAPLIFFSSSVKQYSIESCVAIVFLLLAYELLSKPVSRYYAGWTALLGSVLVWFSHSSVLMIGALGVTLAVWTTTLKSTQMRRAILVVVACWGVSGFAVTIISFEQLSPDVREYMQAFWYPGFPPRSISQSLATGWPLGQVRDLFGMGQNGLAYPQPIMYMILAAAGVAVLWRQNRKTAIVLIAPVVLTLAAAIARVYPFSDRLILFLLPSFMLPTAAAIERISRLIESRSSSLAVFSAALLILPAVYPVAATPPPYRTEHIKPVLAFISEKRQLQDAIYVYYGAAPAITFYGNQYGLRRTDYAIGACHREDARQYLKEIDSFRGRSRVWIVLTHSTPRYHEREDILAYLDSIGSRIDGVLVEPRSVSPRLLPAEAHLYDLSIVQKLAGTTAGSFSLSGASSVGPDGGCTGPQAMVQTDFR